MTIMQKSSEVLKQRANMENFMKSAIMNGQKDFDQGELAKVIKQYTTTFADYGKCRQKEVSFHLNALEKLVLPTQTTKMCLWAMQQGSIYIYYNKLNFYYQHFSEIKDNKFFQKKKSPMFDILSRELELDIEQTKKIQVSVYL